MQARDRTLVIAVIRGAMMDLCATGRARVNAAMAMFFVASALLEKNVT